MIQLAPRPASRSRKLEAWLLFGAVIGSIAVAWAAPQSLPGRPAPIGDSISVDAVPVPMNPQNPSDLSINQFHYAGGLELTSRQTDRLHELSDMYITGTDRLTAVGDEGILFDVRLVLDRTERLVGVRDAHVSTLVGEDGKPLHNKADADAEGLTQLPGGDRLVSFERHHRIWLYPASGGPPRPVPVPAADFPANEGMEALTTDPTVGPRCLPRWGGSVRRGLGLPVVFNNVREAPGSGQT